MIEKQEGRNMNRKRVIVRKDTAKKRMVQWSILISLIIGSLGFTYAAHTNVLSAIISISTSSMDFVFDKGKIINTSVQIQNGSDGTVNELRCNVSYEDKTLRITDIGPIDTEELMDGNAIITINYKIKAEDIEKGIKRPAEVVNDKDKGFDLGLVPFELESNTPIWSLENDNRTWGSKTNGIDGTPDEVYRYLPDNLCEFHVNNKLVPDQDDGVMAGTLTLTQEDVPNLPDSLEIGLSSLNLPDNIIQELKNGSSDSTLQIKGTYGFSIPLNLDQFNVER
jgi:hypothetical protein